LNGACKKGLFAGELGDIHCEEEMRIRIFDILITHIEKYKKIVKDYDLQIGEELEPEKRLLSENERKKLETLFKKTELYLLGLSFLILTGLVINQIHSLPIYYIDYVDDFQCVVKFHILHVLVVISFFMLILFVKNFFKIFILDQLDRLDKKLIFLAVIWIPCTSQVVSAFTQNDFVLENFFEIGTSSFIIGGIFIWIFQEFYKIYPELRDIFSEEIFYNRDRVPEDYF
jgi:Na+/melibiose symporter-like transporter